MESVFVCLCCRGCSGGKRTALYEHMLSKGHKELVQQLTDGRIPPPPTYD